MTHKMLKKARENAAKIDASNVEFRLGELEHLPVADNTVDVAISNCVINLVPDKAQVFRETIQPKSVTCGVALSGRIGGLGRYGKRSERVDRSPCG